MWFFLTQEISWESKIIVHIVAVYIQIKAHPEQKYGQEIIRYPTGRQVPHPDTTVQQASVLEKSQSTL